MPGGKRRIALLQVIQTGNNTYGAFDNQGTSFSASVFSLVSDEPLFEFHFEAPTLEGSYTKGKLTEDTIYRTGSLGKLLTIYTWLVDIGDSIYMDPITKYVVSIYVPIVMSYESVNACSLNLPTRLKISEILCCRPTGVRSQSVRLPPRSQGLDAIVSITPPFLLNPLYKL